MWKDPDQGGSRVRPLCDGLDEDGTRLTICLTRPGAKAIVKRRIVRRGRRTARPAPQGDLHRPGPLRPQTHRSPPNQSALSRADPSVVASRRFRQSYVTTATLNSHRSSSVISGSPPRSTSCGAVAGSVYSGQRRSSKATSDRCSSTVPYSDLAPASDEDQQSTGNYRWSAPRCGRGVMRYCLLRILGGRPATCER